MSFDISLKGPRRSFIVESFTAGGSLLPRTIARFAEASRVKIADETGLQLAELQDGPIPSLRISDIPGIEKVVKSVNNFLAIFDALHMVKPSWVRRSCGLLLYGAHGTGKSLVLSRICETGWGKVFHIDAQMKSSAVREVFKDSRQSQRSIVVIDDIERVVSKDESKYSIEKVLGEEMDLLTTADPSTEKIPAKVLVLAATTVPGEVPKSMRKIGRFNTEVLMPVPDAEARKRILRSLAPLDASDTLSKLLEMLGERTHAYTGGDLELLFNKACKISIERRLGTGKFDGDIDLLQEDIEQALLDVRPTAMHDITLQPPKVRWDEIGGQDNVKKALRRAVEIPLRVSSSSCYV